MSSFYPGRAPLPIMAAQCAGKAVTFAPGPMGSWRHWIEADDQIRVNWQIRRDLFDFDWVEIIRATDEEVERFAVQIGNDPDELHRSRYENMRCIIGSECALSENTIAIEVDGDHVREIRVIGNPDKLKRV